MTIASDRAYMFSQVERKKGIAASPLTLSGIYWSQALMESSLLNLDPVFWYNYRIVDEGTNVPNFMPMFTASAVTLDTAVTDTTVQTAVEESLNGNGWIAFLNEPDGTGGPTAANAAVKWEYIANHSAVVNNNIKLLSPATASDGSAAGWFVDFMAAISRYPDAIAIHSYGHDLTDPSASTAETLTRITSYANTYTGDLWLTEFDLNDGVGGTPTDANVKLYMSYMCLWLERMKRVTRYAWWFHGPASAPQSVNFPNSYLYDDTGAATAIGVHYRDKCGQRPTMAV